MSIDRRTRADILKRGGYQCRQCRSRIDLTIDHIIPRSRGGSNHRSNLQVLCKDCNSRKGNSIPPGAAPKSPEMVAIMRDGKVESRPLSEWFPAIARKKWRWTR